jgi:hypothetical protein
MSLRSRALKRINSNHERTAATDRSSSRASSISEEDERRPEEEKPTQSTEANEENDRSEEQQAKHTIKEAAESKMKGYLNKDYRTLLNSVIEEAAGVIHPDADVLHPSHVGQSFWTSEEKEAFFHALAIKGRDNLPGISHAVKTKSEIEVRTYLLSLEIASSDDQVSSPAAWDAAATEIPAAYEIGERCEHAINLTAEALERHILQHDVELEKEKFGDVWLIDDDMAAKLELCQQEKELAAAIDDNEQVIEISDDSSSESGPENDDVRIQQQEDGDVSRHVPFVEEFAAAGLLKPEVFLQLSRSLFLNSAIDAESNWSQLAGVDGESTTPAIFHSAFENFYNITINFTRWLVHATMFQTMSRLRAKDDQNPAPIVTTADVKTAINFLNLGSDSKKYWAGVARRCGVEVYSDSEKFRDGRPGTKNGRLLTWGEVEGELGFPPDERAAGITHKSEEDEDESASSFSSEMSNEVSAEDDDRSEDDEQSSTSSSGSLNATSKRKRSGSFPSDDDEEEQRLDSLDERASRAEERRLMEMLRYSASPAPSPETEHARDSRSTSRRKRIKIDQRSDWRDHTDYVAEWEQRRTFHESRIG